MCQHQQKHVSNPSTPANIEALDTPGAAYGVEVSGTLAYVADWTMGLRVIDASNPQALVEIGALDTAGIAWQVQVVGALAYLADDLTGLVIIDVSNPAAPIEVGVLDTPGQVRSLQIVGSLAYVGDHTPTQPSSTELPTLNNYRTHLLLILIESLTSPESTTPPVIIH